MANAKGYDASHWQSDGQFSDALDWSDFVFIKAGDGTGVGTDPEFASRWAELDAACNSGKIVLRGAYQWLNGSNGAGEADALISAMGSTGKHARGAFDFEDASATGLELIAACKRYFEVQGHKGLVYGGAKLKGLSSSTRASVAKYADLWLADWTAPYDTISPWAKWTFLQYSGTGLDLDEFNGTVTELKTYLGISDGGTNGGDDELTTTEHLQQVQIYRFIQGVADALAIKRPAGIDSDSLSNDWTRETGDALGKLVKG